MAFKFSGGHMRVKYKQANANYIIIRNNYYFDDEKEYNFEIFSARPISSLSKNLKFH